MKHILCICLSSTIQRTITFKKLIKTNVNRSESYIENASGKAINSCRVLTQLEKGCAKTICPLGQNNAEYFLDLAQKDNLEISYTLIPGNTRTCWTLLDKNDDSTTELVITEPEISDKRAIETAEIKILKMIDEQIDTVDAVLLAGSKPGIWSADLYATIAGITKDRNKIFLADYIGQDLQLTLKQAVPDIIKINEEEFIKTFLPDQKEQIDENKLKEQIIYLSQKFNNMIVITRGTKSTYAAERGKFSECPIISINPVNTTACGDSFNAGFLYEYLNSNDFSKSLEKGTWCASQNAKSQIPGSIL